MQVMGGIRGCWFWLYPEKHWAAKETALDQVLREECSCSVRKNVKDLGELVLSCD